MFEQDHLTPAIIMFVDIHYVYNFILFSLEIFVGEREREREREIQQQIYLQSKLSSVCPHLRIPSVTVSSPSMGNLFLDLEEIPPGVWLLEIFLTKIKFLLICLF